MLNLCCFKCCNSRVIKIRHVSQGWCALWRSFRLCNLDVISTLFSLWHFQTWVTSSPSFQRLRLAAFKPTKNMVVFFDTRHFSVTFSTDRNLVTLTVEGNLSQVTSSCTGFAPVNWRPMLTVVSAATHQSDNNWSELLPWSYVETWMSGVCLYKFRVWHLTSLSLIESLT